MKTYQQGNLFTSAPTKEERIILLVCHRFGVDRSILTGYSNKPEHSDPRRVCWWLLYKWRPLTHEAIAELFSHRNRTTILHGLDYINHLPKVDPLWRAIWELDGQCEELEEAA